jgi:hypothetical protein
MKTAFKRVALVAAAALAIGGISAVSANAAGAYAPGADWTITNAYAVGAPVVAATSTAPSTETATQIAGPANFVTLTVANAGTTTPVQYTGTYFTITGGTTTTGTTSGTTSGSVSIATPTVGTITVTSYQILGGAAFTTATTVTTITVTASVPGTVYGSSSVYGNSGVITLPLVTPTDLTTAAAADSALSITAPSTLSGNVANFQVVENDANGVNLTSGFKAITATVTNGLLASSSGGVSSTNTTYISGTPTGAISDFVLSGLPSVPGVATVTISVNGVVVKTYTAKFSGPAAGFKVDTTSANTTSTVVGFTSPGSVVQNLPIGSQQWWALNTVDAAGNLVSTIPAITVKIADTTVLQDLSVAGIIKVKGLKAGSTTFTVTDTATGLIKFGPVTVNVSDVSAASATLTLDNTSYAAGAPFVLTITAKDANGLPLADGTYTSMATLGTSTLTYNSAGTPVGGTVSPVFSGGVATIKGFAPNITGDLTFTLTLGTAGVVTAAQGAVLTATSSVTSGSADAANAATDAANEATDAANAATDAANAAADSADAATQAAMDAGDKAEAALTAVTALSQQVTTLLAKVASLAATLANITKAIAALPKK